jgi:hypothetical protein
MKKLLLVLAVAGFIAACNNKKSDNSTESTVTQQSTVTNTDTTAKMAPDTTHK